MSHVNLVVAEPSKVDEVLQWEALKSVTNDQKFPSTGWLLPKIYQGFFEVISNFDSFDSKGSSFCLGNPVRWEFLRTEEKVDDSASSNFTRCGRTFCGVL